jgi:hypothetical protein
MKSKKLVFFSIGVLVLLSLLVFAQTKKLREVGRYKLIDIKEGMPTEEVMKTIVEKYAGDIKTGFDLAGASDLYLPFMDQIRQSAFQERELAVGEKMMWMVFRVQGRVKVVYDLEWAGKAPLPVYFFGVNVGDKKYNIIMPKSCGNISLLNVEAGPGAEREAKPALQELTPEERYQIGKAKIYAENYDLLLDVDRYCSFKIWEDELPGLRIIGAERENEKVMFSDGDIVYINGGTNDNLEQGQVFTVLKIEDNLPGYGRLAFKKGRALILSLTDTVATAVIEDSCGDSRIGHYLVPFEPIEGVTGKDLGYNVPPVEFSGVRGKVVYLQNDNVQAASNDWALIDLGARDGVGVGEQLLLYRKIRPDLPIEVFGNSVIINVQSETSTIKVLSCRDALHKDDLVMARPQ